jgi:hypothetical protein
MCFVCTQKAGARARSLRAEGVQSCGSDPEMAQNWAHFRVRNLQFTKRNGPRRGSGMAAVGHGNRQFLKGNGYVVCGSTGCRAIVG